MSTEDTESYWMQRAEFHVDQILRRHAGEAVTERVIRQILTEAFLLGAEVYEHKIASLIHQKDLEIHNLNFELNLQRKK